MSLAATASPSRVRWTVRDVFALCGPPAAWVLMTALFWIGYAGTDDLFYARYAALWHRPPLNWWEFRLLAVLAIRVSFLCLGVNEFAAALPSLLSGLVIFGCVAWFVGWPRDRSWPAVASLFLAATLPIDVGFRTVPLATYLSAALQVLGIVCLIRGRNAVPYLGSAALALAFSSHEIALYPVAIICFTLLVFDWRRFWRPVLACVLFSVLVTGLQCAYYAWLMGDPLARFRVSYGGARLARPGYDPDLNMGGPAFFLWPLKNLIFAKQYSLDLVVLLCTGVLAWRRLDVPQRMLFTATFSIYFYLGYGTIVPWKYQTLYRQFHYYSVMVLGIAALLPVALSRLIARPRWLAPLLITGMIVLQVLICTTGFRWGQCTKTCRALLRYSQAHPDRLYLVDPGTYNVLYALDGYRMPRNIRCQNRPELLRHLMVNKEPAGTPRVRFPERPVDGILLQRGTRTNPPNPSEMDLREFERFLDARRPGQRTIEVDPPRYRPLFRPLIPLLGVRDFMVQNPGAEVIEFATPESPDAPSTARQPTDAGPGG